MMSSSLLLRPEKAVVPDRKRSSRIVEILHRTAKSKPYVWRWQARSLAEDVTAKPGSFPSTGCKVASTRSSGHRVVCPRSYAAGPVLLRHRRPGADVSSENRRLARFL